MPWFTRRVPAVEIFAVEPRRAQLVWRRSGPGEMTVRLTDAAGGSVEQIVATDGGPGSLCVEPLEPGQRYEVTIGGPGLAEVDRHHRFTALVDPPGDELSRVVTVSDSHLGHDRSGYLHTIAERPRPPVGSSERCLRAAGVAMAAWRPDVAVFKGDIVHSGTPEEWAVAREVMAGFDCPVEMMLGNHEAHAKRGDDPIVAAASCGHDLSETVRVRDVAGARLVFADTPVGRTNRGGIGHVADGIVDAAAASDVPVVVFLHHNLQPHRFPTFVPPGIAGHHARRFLERLVDAHPRSMTVSGHTHRNRLRHHRGLPVAEVASSKDYPGVWAGYAIHEGGIRQVCYRIDPPDCLTWTDRTRWAALGLWGRWSPGTADDRCFTHAWPESSQG